MKRVLDGDVVMLPLNNNTVDVFTGMGWDNWSRFLVNKGHPKLIAGKPISEQDYKQLLRLVRE